MSDIFTSETTRAWVDIDLGALVANARTLRARAGLPLLPMIKADAYGLGAARVVSALEPLEPWGYGVGTVEEGEQLRGLDIARPVVVFTPLLPQMAAGVAESNLTPTIGDPDTLRAWVETTPKPFHLEIDTGMRRAGIPWDDAAQLGAVAGIVAGAPGWEGAFTHFHSADVEPESARLQWTRLQQAVATLGARPRLMHAANSAASLTRLTPGADLVRPGIFLYGGRAGGQVPLPVAAFRARVVQVRRIPPGASVSYDAAWRAPRAATVATIAAGYADGVPRALSRGGVVAIGEARCRIVGRVTMDMTMVDVTGASVGPGDVATFYGGDVSVDDQAASADTIAYELLVRLGSRVVRRYR